MGDGAAARKTFNIVRQVNVDDDTLKKIADALGIPEAEHARIRSISGEIHIGPPPTPPSAGPPSTPSSGGSPSTPPSGGPPPTPSSGDIAPATTGRRTRQQE
jgi:hypothetical protein